MEGVKANEKYPILIFFSERSFDYKPPNNWNFIVSIEKAVNRISFEKSGFFWILNIISKKSANHALDVKSYIHTCMLDSHPWSILILLCHINQHVSRTAKYCALARVIIIKRRVKFANRIETNI